MYVCVLTPKLQDQDRSVQDQDRFLGSQTGPVLRPMVSDHITGFDTAVKASSL